MGFAAMGHKIWPVTPDWRNGLQERLAFGTDVMQAPSTAVTQHRALQLAPTRSFTFEVAAAGRERRAAEMLLAGHVGPWQLPIWPDVQWLTTPISAGADEIPCATVGFDFVAGGLALLYTSINRWEVVEVASVESGAIALEGTTAAAYGPGSRLYPLRRARVQPGAEERARSSNFGRRLLTFDVDEPCDWPLLVGATEYLGHPVLTQRPDESDDPVSSLVRLIEQEDGDGLPFVHDTAGVALRMQRTHWKLFGRAEHSWYRSLVYTLDGRRVPMWLPSGGDDLKPTAAVAGGSTSLVVEWAGYTLFGLNRVNRKDVRIELDDGSTLLRRITDALQVGETETLTLNASLDGASIAVERIRQVSFMALSTLASDQVEIQHVTDAEGVATSTLGWQAVVPDV